MTPEEKNVNKFDESLDGLRASDLAPPPQKKKQSTGALVSTLLWLLLAAVFLGVAVWASANVVSNLVDFSGARRDYDEVADNFSPLNQKSNRPDALVISTKIGAEDDCGALIDDYIRRSVDSSLITAAALSVKDAEGAEVTVLTKGDVYRLDAILYPKTASEAYYYTADSSDAVRLNGETGEFTALNSGKTAVTFTLHTASGAAAGAVTLPLRDPLVLRDREIDGAVSVNDPDKLCTLAVGQTLTLDIVRRALSPYRIAVEKNGADKDCVNAVLEQNTLLLTGVFAGKCSVVLTLTLNGQTFVYTVYPSVSETPVPTVALSEHSLYLTEGDRTTLSVGTRNVEGAPVFTVSDPTVLSVSSSGEVVALKAGDATITVTSPDGLASDSCAVTVVPQPVTPTPPVEPTEPTDPADPSTEPPTEPVKKYREYEDSGADPMLSHDKFLAMRSNLLEMRRTYSNNDILGWICIPGSNIDYPLMLGADNDYYLVHNYKKSYTNYGSIYADYRCSSDLRENQMTFVYGHNVRNDMTMFNWLLKYKNEKIFNNKTCRYIYVYTDYAVLKYDVFSVYDADKTECPTGLVNYPSAKMFLNTINTIKNNSLYQRQGLELYENDRVIMLYTCANSTLSSQRTLVFGVLVGVGT